MIRRGFMKFAPKEKSEEKNRKQLQKNNVPVYEGPQATRFDAYSQTAKDINTQRNKQFGPSGKTVTPADNVYRHQRDMIYNNQFGRKAPGADSSNPYAQTAAVSGNPYASVAPPSNARSAGSYGTASSVSNPYASDPYTSPSASKMSSETSTVAGLKAAGDSETAYSSTSTSTYGDLPASRGYGGYERPSAQSYGPSAYEGEPLRRTQTSQSQQNARNQLFGNVAKDPELDELNETSSILAADAAAQEEEDELNYADLDSHPPLTRSVTRDSLLTVSSSARIPGRSAVAPPLQPETLPEVDEEEGDELDELNELPMHLQPYSGRPKEEQFEDSDDDVEEIKREIRFTKIESVQATRNALRMAAEAETSGRNAMGMLGWQGEKLANTDATLALTDTQAKIATENTAELKRLNRSIFLPNLSNKFNSRRRNQEKEARMRSEQAQEQAARERRGEQQMESEQRVTDALNETAFGTRRNFERRESERRGYQFEADSEDEEMEDEIAENLDALGDHATRLNKLALSMNEEVDSQNKLIGRLSRDVDRVDVDIHMNTTRMATIN